MILVILLSIYTYDGYNFCFTNRSFDENGSYNPGKEIKAETQTYYQGLIDNRDSPFVVSFPLSSGAMCNPLPPLKNNTTV